MKQSLCIGLIAGIVAIIACSSVRWSRQRTVPAPVVLGFDDAEEWSLRSQLLGKVPPPERVMVRHAYMDRLVSLRPGQRLDEVIASLASQAHVKLSADWKSLQYSGGRPAARVDLSLRAVPLRQALQELLRPDTLPDSDLGYRATNDGVTIIPGDRSGTEHIVRVYDVRPLIHNQATFSKAMRNASAGIHPGQQDMPAEELLDAVASGVYFDDDVRAVTHWAGHLLVTATAGEHDRLMAFLNLLHQAGKENAGESDAGQKPETPRPETWSPADRPVVVTTRPDQPPSQLQRVIDSMQLDDARLEDAIALLQAHTDANLRVRWRSLEMEGIEKDTPVSLRLRNTTVEQALQELLAEAGEYSGGHLGFRVDGNVVIIASTTQPVVRLYDVRDLLLAAVRVGNSFPASYPFVRDRSSSELRSIRKTSVCVEQDVADSLIDCLTSAVGHNGSFFPSIRYFSGHIAVVRTEADHVKVEQFLQIMRQSLLSSPTTQPHAPPGQ